MSNPGGDSVSSSECHGGSAGLAEEREARGGGVWSPHGICLQGVGALQDAVESRLHRVTQWVSGLDGHGRSTWPRLCLTACLGPCAPHGFRCRIPCRIVELAGPPHLKNSGHRLPCHVVPSPLLYTSPRPLAIRTLSISMPKWCLSRGSVGTLAIHSIVSSAALTSSCKGRGSQKANCCLQKQPCRGSAGVWARGA